jgi:hypothetical protein
MELTEGKRHEIVNLLVGFDENRRKETERSSERFLDGVGYGVRIAVRALFGDGDWERVMLSVYARVDDYGSRADSLECPHGNDRLECPNCQAIRLEDAGYTLDGRACEYEPNDPNDGPESDGTCPDCGYYPDQHVGGKCPKACQTCQGNGFLGDIFVDDNNDCPRCNRSGIEPGAE